MSCIVVLPASFLQDFGRSYKYLVQPPEIKFIVASCFRPGHRRRPVELALRRARSNQTGNALGLSPDSPDEIEFAKANTAAREEAAALEERRVTLVARLVQERDRAAMVAKVPTQIGAFIEDFQNLDPRLQKAQLQTILKAVHVWNDGRIELEFRA